MADYELHSTQPDPVDSDDDCDNLESSEDEVDMTFIQPVIQPRADMTAQELLEVSLILISCLFLLLIRTGISLPDAQDFPGPSTNACREIQGDEDRP
jgi:hypothetical protein